MTQKEKQLLLKDLCARLPYGLKGRDCFGKTRQMVVIYDTGTILAHEIDGVNCGACGFVPYLRPISSMTQEEKCQFRKFVDWTYDCNWKADTIEGLLNGCGIIPRYAIELFDWLNTHHFDYHDLIPMGLALEAPEGMYNI